jgi:hypothetical protein
MFLHHFTSGFATKQSYNLPSCVFRVVCFQVACALPVVGLWGWLCLFGWWWCVYVCSGDCNPKAFLNNTTLYHAKLAVKHSNDHRVTIQHVMNHAHNPVWFWSNATASGSFTHKKAWSQRFAHIHVHSEASPNKRCGGHLELTTVLCKQASSCVSYVDWCGVTTGYWSILFTNN